MLPPLPSYLCSQSGLPAPSPSHTPPAPIPSHIPDLGSVLTLTLPLSAPHPLSNATPGPRPAWVPRIGLPDPSPPLCPTGFFLLGGLCVVWGGASYVVGLAALRGPMQLSVGGAAAGVGAVLAAGLLWACAVGLYMGQLELDVELVPEDDGTAAAEGPDEAGRPPPE